MTWAAIVGEANLRDMRIGMTGGGTRPVKAASVAATDASAAIPVNTPANAVADGTEFTNAVNGSAWQGIAGTVFCAGSDCEVSSGGLLSGSWYFTPDLPGEPYVAADDGMGYLRETLYARFGHWLTVVAGSGETTVHAYAGTAAMGDPALGAPAGDLTESSASYAGKAAGMSVHMTFDDQGARTGISSGAFTADVSLTARFGASPTVSGTVSGFEGNAVDAGWSVELGEAVLSGSIDLEKPARPGGPARPAHGRHGPMARRTNARREYSAASTPTSPTATRPGPTPPESSSPEGRAALAPTRSELANSQDRLPRNLRADGALRRLSRPIVGNDACRSGSETAVWFGQFVHPHCIGRIAPKKIFRVKRGLSHPGGDRAVKRRKARTKTRFRGLASVLFSEPCVPWTPSLPTRSMPGLAGR